MPSISINIASHPPRAEGLKRVVEALLPQCDVLRLYLNKYPEIPDWLKDPRIEAVCSLTHGDLRSHGKFYWIDPRKDEFYLTADDDIIYPSDYVARMIEGIEKYRRRAVCSFHGGLLTLRADGSLPRWGNMGDNRKLIGYSQVYRTDIVCHTLGAGLMGCHPRTIGLDISAFSESEIGSGDDEDLALWGQKTNTPLVRLATQANWLMPMEGIWDHVALHRDAGYISSSMAKIRAYSPWRLMPLPPAR